MYGNDRLQQILPTQDRPTAVAKRLFPSSRGDIIVSAYIQTTYESCRVLEG